MQRNPDRTLHYFELDRQGSVTGHTRGDGTRTASFRYQPFGNYERVTGADSGQADNFIGFQGGFFINSPAHTQFGHRWYDSRLGRFTQPDPIGTPGASGDGQSNRSGIGGPYSVEQSVYSFAASNPCNFSDRSGLAIDGSSVACGFGIFALAGGFLPTVDVTAKYVLIGLAIGASGAAVAIGAIAVLSAGLLITAGVGTTAYACSS